MSDFLREQLQKTGMNLSDRQIEQLNLFYEMLIEKNKVMNLTAITEYDDVVIKHFIDSLAIIHAVDFENVHNIIDVGTGAGFPGIVLKIAFPQIKITLLDSLRKRIGFLQETAAKLDLDGITFLHGRAEDFAHQEAYREQYDLCVSRAVANLASLSEYCLPFVKPGKIFVAYKASDCMEEYQAAQNAIRLLNGGDTQCITYRLPDTDIDRIFIKVFKLGRTNSKFPRKAGIPTKEPLK